MINFNISLLNPWGFTDYTATHSKHYKLSKNKSLDIEYNGSTSTLLRLDFTYSYAVDHGGFFLELGLLSKNVRINLYDNRHWDEYTNDYL